jgi:ribosome recycling factor
MSHEVIKQAKQRMEKVEADLRAELATMRTGRASVSILDHIKVDYYGTPTPLREVGKLAIGDPTTLLVQPWDVSILPFIEKAIRSSDLGLNPANDGKVIRVPIPALTDERRKEIVKHLHKVLENHRTAVRNIRRDINDSFKKLLKDKKMSEDEEKRGLEEAQKLTDQTIAHAKRGTHNRRRIAASAADYRHFRRYRRNLRRANAGDSEICTGSRNASRDVEGC